MIKIRFLDAVLLMNVQMNVFPLRAFESLPVELCPYFVFIFYVHNVFFNFF